AIHESTPASIRIPHRDCSHAPWHFLFRSTSRCVCSTRRRAAIGHSPGRDALAGDRFRFADRALLPELRFVRPERGVVHSAFDAGDGMDALIRRLGTTRHAADRGDTEKYFRAPAPLRSHPDRKLGLEIFYRPRQRFSIRTFRVLLGTLFAAPLSFPALSVAVA